MNIRKVVIVILLVCSTILAYDYFSKDQLNVISYSRLINHAEQNNVDHVQMSGYDVRGMLKDGTSFASKLPYQDKDFLNIMLLNKVDVQAQEISRLSDLFLQCYLPLILYLVGIIYCSGRFPGGGNKYKRKQDKSQVRVLFADIGGLRQAKIELQEVVDYLKTPEKYKEMGVAGPKGVLLVGPPGTGKTFLAKAVAGEANIPFYSVSGSEFVEMYVGLGAARVRRLFATAVAHAPAIIFIDEIDAIGGMRGMGAGGGSGEYEKTLNELLIAMDGFSTNNSVVVIAATNRSDILDSALMRRFERQIMVDLPDRQERAQIVEVLSKKIKLDTDVDLEFTARRLVGCSGATIKAILNEAGLIACRHNRKSISQADIDQATDRMFLGIETPGKSVSQEERELVAYHEAGHALAAHYLNMPIYKMTIVPRGHAGGMVFRLPIEKSFTTLTEYKHDLIMTAAGRAAEIIKYGFEKTTSGAISDMKQATSVALDIVTKWGLSPVVGPVYYNFYKSDNLLSDALKHEISQEVKLILIWAQEQAKKLILKYMDKFELLAKTVLERETLSGQDIKDLLADNVPALSTD